MIFRSFREYFENNLKEPQASTGFLALSTGFQVDAVRFACKIQELQTLNEEVQIVKVRELLFVQSDLVQNL